MNKRWAVAGVVAAVVSVGGGSLAAAEPPNREPEVFICDGVETEIITAGRNGWVDGVKYKAVQFTFEGDGFTDTKVWGGGKDLNDPDAITCVSPDGSFTVIAVPA